MIELCQECLHLIFDDRCRCTEGKVIGCMYIGLVENCIYYDENSKKRCKGRVVETEWGKTCMCSEHTHTYKNKKSNKTKISTNKSETEKAEKKTKKTSETEKAEKKTKKTSETEKTEKTERTENRNLVKPQKRKPKKIVKNIQNE